MSKEFHLVYPESAEGPHPVLIPAEAFDIRRFPQLVPFLTVHHIIVMLIYVRLGDICTQLLQKIYHRIKLSYLYTV